MAKLAIIGDFNSHRPSHQATNQAIAHSLKSLKCNLSYDWIPTEDIKKNFDSIIEDYKAFWISPGSPYKNMMNVLHIIEYARRNNIPTFGTCGGFQHMIIEFCRNVLAIRDAQHAENDPYASELVITPLTCNLKG